MNNKYLDQADEFLIDEEKHKAISKQDGELFDEKSYIPHDMINVRRNRLPRNGVEWEVLVNKKSVLVLKGIRFSKKEIKFLETPEGLLYIMAGYRSGLKNTSAFKKSLGKRCKK